MASSAVAQGTIASLRHQIAKIEGRLAERLDGGREDIDQDVDLRPAWRRAEQRSSRHRRRTFRYGAGWRPARRRLTEIHAPIRAMPARRRPSCWRWSASSSKGLPLPSSGSGWPKASAKPAILIRLACASSTASTPPGCSSRRRTSLSMRCGSPRRPRALDGFSAVLLEIRGNARPPRPDGDAAAAPPRPGCRATRCSCCARRPCPKPTAAPVPAHRVDPRPPGCAMF